MVDTYFDPGAQRAEKVRDLFTVIAPRYDLVNDLQSFGLHRRWKRRLIEMSRPLPGQAALDVCCGTGDLAIELVARGLRVTGLDFSRRMLEIARHRAAKILGQANPTSQPTATLDPGFPPGKNAPGKPHPAAQSSLSTSDRSKTGHLAIDQTPAGELDFVQADALQLPFPDNQFDIVTIAYGLRNLADWRRGLLEMQRVARPAGRLLVLDFAKPPHPVWRALYFAYLRTIVPMLGLLFLRNAGAYRYILESLHHYAGPEEIAANMRATGLWNVRIATFLGGIMTIHYGEKR